MRRKEKKAGIRGAPKNNAYTPLDFNGLHVLSPQFQALKQTLQAHKYKGESILQRRNLVQNQKRQNYQNEYDRIRNFRSTLDHSFPNHVVAKLLAREKELEDLGVKAVGKIPDY